MKKKIKYKYWLEEWLSEKINFVKQATYANYSIAVINHIIPILGEYYLEEITESKVQETILFWLKEGRIDRKGGLSEKTVKDMLMIIKRSIRTACKKYKLPIEEMDIKFPTVNKIERKKILSMDEQKKLISAILLAINHQNIGILLTLYTGIRIGELCALQWKDINLENQTVSITKTLQRIYIKNVDGKNYTKVIISTPKTCSSNREIPISSFLLPYFNKNHHFNAENYILTGQTTYMEPRIFRKYYEQFLLKNNINYINFHGLRHTFATRLIQAGADVKTVSVLLGHSCVSMTLNLYVHPQLEQKRKCVELITL